jgi:hypothetical protein
VANGFCCCGDNCGCCSDTFVKNGFATGLLLLLFVLKGLAVLLVAKGLEEALTFVANGLGVETGVVVANGF